jgi:hypothetical protein
MFGNTFMHGEEEEEENPDSSYLQDLISQLGAANEEPSAGPAMLEFQKHLDNLPQREKIGLGKRILLSLAGGFVGPEKAIAAADAPYNRQVNDWTLKGRNLSHLADIESQGQQRSAQRKMGMMGMGLREFSNKRRADIDIGKAAETRDYHTGMLGAADKRADAAAKSAEGIARYREGSLSENQKRTRILQGSLDLRKAQEQRIAAAKKDPSVQRQLFEQDQRIQEYVTRRPEANQYFESLGSHLTVGKLLVNAPEDIQMEIWRLLDKNMQNRLLPKEAPTGLMATPSPVEPDVYEEDEETPGDVF